ncbi:hypothetical protein FQA18_02225, partial [Haloferax volcanii]
VGHLRVEQARHVARDGFEPGGHVAFGGEEVTGVVARGDEVSVTGRVVRGRDRERRRLLTGPRFVVRAGDT